MTTLWSAAASHQASVTNPQAAVFHLTFQVSEGCGLAWLCEVAASVSDSLRRVKSGESYVK